MHELAFAECPKSYVFRGSKEYQPKQIADMLGLNPSNRAAPRPGQPMPAPAASKFLMQVQECEFQLTSILEGLQRDPWPVEQDRRALRCTGVALGVAVSLLEVSHWQSEWKIWNKELMADCLPEHWCPNHALRWWTCYRWTRSCRLA